MPDVNASLSNVLAGLRDEYRKVIEPVLGGQSIALVDFPYHPNSGDSLIWLGERSALAEFGSRVRYSSTLNTYRAQELREAHPDGPIVLHGGGNLGDRWVHHQKFRECVIADFPNRKIVQLPQSLEFGSEDEAQRVGDVFSSHPDLTVLLRERRQLPLGRRLFSDNVVRYCPDSAFMGSPVRSRGEGRAPTHDVVFLLRRDTESVVSAPPIVADLVSVVKDWGFEGIFGPFRWKLFEAAEKATSAVAPIRRRLRGGRGLDLVAETNVRTAVRIVERGRVVVTDRLHAMVLCVLLGIPVVALANENGKVEAIFNEVLKGVPMTAFAGSMSEAIECARSVVLGLSDRL